MAGSGCADVLERLESLVSPYGVMSAVLDRRPERGLDRVVTCASVLGSGVPGRGISAPGWQGTMGGGQALDDRDLARLIAIAEGAERYSGRSVPGERLVLAQACALDGPSLDPQRIPRCSEKEITAGCRLTPLDPGVVIRWIRGVDLSSGQPTWLPAVMGCYGIDDPLPSENFWYRISTGFAVHSDPAEALVHGICEVVERDLIAVAWLQQLPLPLIVDSQLPVNVKYLTDWADRHYIETYLFDATSDIGVPTAYCLQIAPHDEQARQVVGCGTGRTLGAAAEKAFLEAIGLRNACYSGAPLPPSFTEFASIDDGARYMARAERAEAFEFLVRDARERIAPERHPLPVDPLQALTFLVDSLSSCGMQVLAVDRTPPEIAAAGLTAVSVVIPDLQPMTVLPLTQFRAHPRLYAAPALMGYRTLTEEELNPWPQPFA